MKQLIQNSSIKRIYTTGKKAYNLYYQLFLKYYSDTGKDTSQIDRFRWGDNDRKKYFEAICNRLSDFIEGGK